MQATTIAGDAVALIRLRTYSSSLGLPDGKQKRIRVMTSFRRFATK